MPVLILTGGLLLRLAGIASRPIWYDEAFAILFARQGPAAMVYGTLTPAGPGAADIHPLGYYTLLWLWMKGVGDSVTAARCLSLLAGIITLVIVWRLAEEIFDRKAALAGLALAAFLPFHIHYSQEIRMYACLALWLMLATYCYQRASRRGGKGWWLGFALAAALAQYTHNLAAFYLLPLALWPLIRREWRNALHLALAGAGALLLYLPWLIHLPAQISKVSASYWTERPGLAKLFTLLLTYTTHLPLPENWLPLALFAALTVTALALLETFKIRTQRSSGFWLLYLAFAPPVLLFLVSQWFPLYLERALLPSGLFFCLWLGWALTQAAMPRGLQAGLAALIVVNAGMGWYQHLTYQGFPYVPSPELTQFLRENRQAGDVIVHSNKLSWLPALYYDPGLAQECIADPPGSPTDTLAPATQQALGIQSQPDLESAVAGARRVWFIIFEQSIAEYQQAGLSTHPHLAWLTARYRLEEERSFGDLRLYLFVAP
ncbi:MAG: glycosyltransferase family 39 protein [Anaerolineales bacterium]